MFPWQLPWILPILPILLLHLKLRRDRLKTSLRHLSLTWHNDRCTVLINKEKSLGSTPVRLLAKASSCLQALREDAPATLPVLHS